MEQVVVCDVDEEVVRADHDLPAGGASAGTGRAFLETGARSTSGAFSATGCDATTAAAAGGASADTKSFCSSSLALEAVDETRAGWNGADTRGSWNGSEAGEGVGGVGARTVAGEGEGAGAGVW